MAAGVLTTGHVLSDANAAPAIPAWAERPFGFNDVVRYAEAAAAHPFVAPDESLPGSLADIDYTAYRGIHFRPDHAIWHGERQFELQLFHRGYLYKQKIEISLIERGRARPLLYDPAMFDLGGLPTQNLPPDLGFAGFRIHAPLNGVTGWDEFAVFQGASYFRLRARGQEYGLSARGLGIDTSGAGEEEFPVFRAFWIEEPAPDQRDLTVYALLDSRSASGAFSFRLSPSVGGSEGSGDTLAEVSATLFPRRPISGLGLAPLTSMYQFGTAKTAAFDDYRPQVHDSDGLQVLTGTGEWLWTPLSNPRSVRTDWVRTGPSTAERLGGFGLIQRERSFDAYLDIQARYQSRPSHWVEPVGEWPAGHLELFAIPTENEFLDNIVSYWVPATPPLVGQPFSYAYRVRAFDQAEALPPLGRVAAMWIDSAQRLRPIEPADPSRRLFLLEFTGKELRSLPAETQLDVELHATHGALLDPYIEKNGYTGGWRVYVEYRPAPDQLGDLRCRLLMKGRVMTETWRYLWPL